MRRSYSCATLPSLPPCSWMRISASSACSCVGVERKHALVALERALDLACRGLGDHGRLGEALDGDRAVGLALGPADQRADQVAMPSLAAQQRDQRLVRRLVLGVELDGLAQCVLGLAEIEQTLAVPGGRAHPQVAPIGARQHVALHGRLDQAGEHVEATRRVGDALDLVEQTEVARVGLERAAQRLGRPAGVVELVFVERSQVGQQARALGLAVGERQARLVQLGHAGDVVAVAVRASRAARRSRAPALDWRASARGSRWRAGCWARARARRGTR